MSSPWPPASSDEYARPAVEDLARRFGPGPIACVYFIQRREDGPIKIGTTQGLAGRIGGFLNASPDPVIIRATVAGGQALESWFHRRHRERQRFYEWFDDADAIVDDALDFAAAQHAAFLDAEGDHADRIRAATVATVRDRDATYRDVETLYRNRVNLREIAKLADLDAQGARTVVEQMRTLGFAMGYRNVYASRSDRLESEPRRARLLG